ncbi:helix-turn-helix transcriptional regulator [Bernardetia sp. MNP-M8]|uniref:helix-turn-helix transcriptional regulator n=1 Tax=Bernardetia sp. MNP-M8 TaxID=3127470 RepID=UPI0030D5B3FE
MNQYFNFSVARKELNLSQEEMAEEIGISRVTIGNTERGKNLSHQYLNHLEKKGYSKEWLLGESDVKKTLNNDFTKNDKEFIILELREENKELKKENKSLRQELYDLKDKFMAFQGFVMLHAHKFKQDELQSLSNSLGKDKTLLEHGFVAVKKNGYKSSNVLFEN